MSRPRRRPTSRGTRKAAAQAKALIRHAKPGSKKTKTFREMKLATVARAIYRRWGVGPYGWQCKHVDSYLQEFLARNTQASAYVMWIAIRDALAALGHEEDWVPRLRGRWIRPEGDSRPLSPKGRKRLKPGGVRINLARVTRGRLAQ